METMKFRQKRYGRWFYALFGLMCYTNVFAADSSYVRRITDTLSSGYFMGRGYVANGVNRAGDFIVQEMQRLGLNVDTQNFSFPVNTFPGRIALSINGKPLRPGIDFLVTPQSKACSGAGTLTRQEGVGWINTKHSVFIQPVEKLTWSVAQHQADYTAFLVKESLLSGPVEFKCTVDAQHLENYPAKNITGSITGSTRPDSVIVFTAHYDHLGAMGSGTYFPGANDNAGGVAMMLDLADYFIRHPPEYTVRFIAFAGEEAGLLGSKHYVDHSPGDLKKIRFLVNLDLVGNGEEGITVVNATEFPEAFRLLQAINTEQQLIRAINSRGKAKNSDHYWFTEHNVPSFFIYTLGERKAYHDVFDVPGTLPFFEIHDLEKLVILFAQHLMGVTG